MTNKLENYRYLIEFNFSITCKNENYGDELLPLIHNIILRLLLRMGNPCAAI